MADDPYSVLGVAKTASDDDIRRAFRKLAKELHPDLNPGAQAEERFKKVSAANEILGDPDKRRQFDRGEIDARGEPVRSNRHAGAPGFGGRGARPNGRGGFEEFGFGDVFTDLFGQQGGVRTGSRGGFAQIGRAHV